MLEGFFSPRSVAVVGVAREEGKVGHCVFHNLIESGFEGEVYPVNPNADEIHGHRCYASLDDLPVVPELAVLVVPARVVPDVIEQCGLLGIPSVIVISAGFKEAGPEGGALERELLARAHEHGVRVLGPNCLGVISGASRLNASFAGSMPPPGGISFMSQSGALGTAILDWVAGEGIGLADFVSLGNRADISEVDLLERWTADESTRVVVAYLESIADGGRFLEAAHTATLSKPVIAVKSGGSDAGARAVSSHTGSLAGSEVAYDAAFRRTGVIRARTVQELFDWAAAFSRQPLPSGHGVAIVTNAGGPAVMATDACEREGVSLASLSGATIDELRATLPPAAALYNPIDILGDAPPERYASTLKTIYADPDVRAVLCICTPQAMTDPRATARALVRAARGSGKTTLACFMGRDSMEEAWSILKDGGVPNAVFPERSVSALGAMFSYARYLDRPAIEPARLAGDCGAVRAILDSAAQAGHAFVTEQAASDIAAAYGIAVPRGGVGHSIARAREIASEIGYPVVGKIASPDILHKSDIGGIRVGIADAEELESVYDQIMARSHSYAPDAVVSGLLVQEMVPAGREVIIGVDRDPTFGPVLMFGLGGVFVEVLKDVTFRLCPLDRDEAREMVSEIRGFGLLRGARGQRPADVDAITDVICRISALVMDHPDILELDINPLIVGETGSGAIAADIRIGIGGQR